MLYVFHVEVGRMLSFDMTVALSSVENLKETIQRLHGIPAANIVLLVSGGEMLTQSTQVSYYSAGTDTNPIYMLITGDERPPPTIANTDADVELRRQVEESHKLPPVMETVRQRSHLAQQMRELARKEENVCERLVHDQHLQQQGWSAVVANMEDLTNEFRDRFHNFCLSFDRHLQKRPAYLNLLLHFGDDLKKLSRIPILPGLMALAEADFHGFDELLDNDDVFSRSQMQQTSVVATATTASGAAGEQIDGDTATTLTESAGGDVDKSSTSPNKKLKMEDEEVTNTTTAALTATDDQAERISQTSTTSSNLARRLNLNLLQWITSKGNHNALQLMSDECVQGLETFNEDIYEKLKQEVRNIIKLAEQSDVKEIKGLSDRLCKLEEFKYKIKKMVQDQKEQATSLQQNESRALNLRDNSVLPDLCLSHKSQLQVMLENHIKIREHCRCISNSKEELGKNLHTRLKRIVWIENGMSEFDNRLLFYHRCLKRAERHINIIEQIHRAPSTYVAAVTEVVRRKIFSDEFRLWASRLAIDFDRIHGEEIRRRLEFNANFDGHFLNILFPGMGDMPPAFANEHPLSFDTRLPNLTRSDIDMLTTHLPELTPDVQLPDMGPVIEFFVSRSGEQQRERMEQLLREQVAAAVELMEKSPVLQNQRLNELRGTAACDDSQTDTETEFEKVVQEDQVVATIMTTSVGTSTCAPVEHMARSTLTEETEVSMRGEAERKRARIDAMSKLAIECLRTARCNLDTFRSDAQGYQDELRSELQLLQDKWNVLRMQCEAREEDVAAQAADAQALNIKCATLEAQAEELRDQLKTAQLEKQAAVAEAREELIHEHKTEIESLRCRFKLMTSMERSPSDTSLEKLERPTSSASGGGAGGIDVEQLLLQQRIEMEAQRERAISEAVEAERSLWQSRVLPLNSESVMANVNILKDMLEDKERQLDMLREQNKVLTQENFQLKTRLDVLTNEDGNSWLKEKIEYLNRDKCRLEEELNQEKVRRQEMETSVAAMKCSTYEQHGGASGSSLIRSKSSSASQRYITLEGCAKGDLVFVVWSMRHGQFMVVQDSNTLYFVHGDSLTALQLSTPPAPVEGVNAGAITEVNQIPIPYYAIGRVIDKEYCQARKDENRYRVIKGSKFYRIKLSPLLTRSSERRLQSLTSGISRSISDTLPQQLSGGNAGLPAIRDVPDSAIVVTSSTRPSVGAQLTFKERTMSISSVNEEDDESASLLSERCRYISVSEEDEMLAAGGTAAVAPAPTIAAATQLKQQHLQPQQQQQQQKPHSVITEQPTASSKLKLDLLLASADIVTQSPTQQQDVEVDAESESALVATTIINTDTNNIITISATSTTTMQAEIDPNANPTTTTNLDTSTTQSTSKIFEPTQTTTTPTMATTTTIPPTVNVDIVDPVLSTAPMLPMSIGTTISEDSDEYRSLEGKDEADFPISE
ncbi:RB1-inducible coiled-coil protein 1 [Scaptodrosophila lebanonensis]|uniref:RB1-inducible coiled-coil protein 1 n=1 Tax=Drosophila lebanonensis TaxID=7225 RepID=A0A6J2TGF5_DROLE|nr:RB1-inducible coiled-coil protein 1 [Scaptodrosophila lebanonensis]XP_030375796.1 RB1-inducible coiled-coil protein 1 [Scaptodrosophila lebanonensis]